MDAVPETSCAGRRAHSVSVSAHQSVPCSQVWSPSHHERCTTTWQPPATTRVEPSTPGHTDRRRATLRAVAPPSRSRLARPKSDRTTDCDPHPRVEYLLSSCAGAERLSYSLMVSNALYRRHERVRVSWFPCAEQGSRGLLRSIPAYHILDLKAIGGGVACEE
jgi:hypothetical protein